MHIGVIGCGQLARMMALAGWDMGIRFSFLAEPGETRRCIDGLGPVTTRQKNESAREIYLGLGEPDVVTIEREHVDTALLHELKEFCQVYPDPGFVSNCQDRLREKAMLGRLGIPTAPSARGEIVLYPATENRHRDGILLTSLAPADNVSPRLLEDACDYMRSLLEELDYIGVLAMECFVTPDEILVNELAPRVHNSGHWTMNGEPTSQFENHLRAILGLNLGAASTTRHQGMINILGGYDRCATLHELSPQSALFDYNKIDEPGRKLGHINVYCDGRSDLVLEMNRLQRCLYPEVISRAAYFPISGTSSWALSLPALAKSVSCTAGDKGYFSGDGKLYIVDGIKDQLIAHIEL